MPTVLRIGKYRFHFYSNEGLEPPHIHIDTPEGDCKFWLNPVELAKSRGIAPPVLRDLQSIEIVHESLLLEKYYEFHGR
ncbi:MAG: DUF4160 domain-containing protein [Spirochaetota bacterium]